jgi:hypothetical protein
MHKWKRHSKNSKEAFCYLEGSLVCPRDELPLWTSEREDKSFLPF